MPRGKKELNNVHRSLIQKGRIADSNYRAAKTELHNEIFTRAQQEYEERLEDYRRARLDAVWAAHKGGVPNTVIGAEILKTTNKATLYSLLAEMRAREEAYESLNPTKINSRYTLGEWAMQYSEREGGYKAYFFDVKDSQHPDDKYSIDDNLKSWFQPGFPVEGEGIRVHAKHNPDTGDLQFWFVDSERIAATYGIASEKKLPELYEYLKKVIENGELHARAELTTYEKVWLEEEESISYGDANEEYSYPAYEEEDLTDLEQGFKEG